jgi:lysozyme
VSERLSGSDVKRFTAFAVALCAVVAGCAGGGDDIGQSSAALTVCPSTVVEGLDVYDGQGTIDWTSVAGSGRAFVFIKATQGNYDTQTTFAANWSGAKAAGILRSPYHFFDGTIDGVTQAQFFLAELTAQGGLADGDLPPMLDIECPTSSSQSAASANCEYSGNSGWVATATLSQRIFDWLTTVQQATGRAPFVYSYPSWFAGVGVTNAMLANYPLFIATYATCADVPAPWTSMVFWQYSATATVPGVSGDCDVDRFVGDMAQLKALTATPTPDAGDDASDANTPDAAPTDAALEASGADATDEDAGTKTPPASGCSCDLGAPSSPMTGLWGVLVMLAIRGRRRTRPAACCPRPNT